MFQEKKQHLSVSLNSSEQKIELEILLATV